MKKYKPLIYSFQTDYLSAFLESTFDLEKDVELIYNLGFKDFFNKIKKYGVDSESFLKLCKDIINDINSLNGKNVFKKINSKILITEESQKANKIKFVDIYCGCFVDGSLYDPKNNLILISINYNMIKAIADTDYKNFLKHQNKSNIKSILNEFTFQNMDSNIYHELAHWVDDCFHNNFLSNLVNKAIELQDADIILLNKKNVDLTYFEINAQIHGIKNLKRYNIKDWDQLTLTDVFFKYPALRGIYIDIYKKYGKQIVDLWQKNIIKRMHRENLLGKNMSQYVDYKIFIEKKYVI